MRGLVRYLGFALGCLAIVFAPLVQAAKGVRPTSLAGYKAVPVHYGELNKMIMGVGIDGHPANLIVDTGARQTILDSDAAASFGVSPSRHGLRYVGSTRVNGQLFPVAYVRSLTAGPMNFGGASVVLLKSNSRQSFSTRGETGNLRVAGVLGTDLLRRNKAVINTRTRLIFFQAESSRQLQLAHVAASQKFISVPLQPEENGTFTVPCSINGRPGRLLVDTGAFVTTFDEAALKSLGISLQPTHAMARYATGPARQIQIGEINHLTIGDFKMPPVKLGATVLPKFAIQQGNTRIDGILGMEMLVICHAIIDFGSMTLFLK